MKPVIVSQKYSGPERRTADRSWKDSMDEWKGVIEERLAEGALNMNILHTGLTENTELTKQVHADTREVIEAFKSAKDAFHALEVIARWLRPVGVIATSIAAIWGFFTFVKGKH